jgi:hypothetical protein
MNTTALYTGPIQTGTDYAMPQGTGPAQPYGLSEPTSAAPTDSLNAQTQSTDSANSNIGYRPTSKYMPSAGRADRLGANIVGGLGSFDGLGDGGYSGGATQRM